MKSNDYISPYVIKRLPLYYRYLEELMKEGKERTSSGELSVRMGLTASQIRQDLGCFGEFGRQGYGYSVEVLRKELANIIGVEKLNTVIIVGAGNMGQAICDNISFEKRGCTLMGIFDKDHSVIGKTVANHKIMDSRDLPDFCKKNNPRIAVVCVPKESAKSVCENLVGLGVTNFWNFSHFDIKLHFDGVNVENVHLGDSLLTLVYSVNAQ